MIIKGRSRRNAKWFATHLSNTEQGKQLVSMAERRGLGAMALEGSLQETLIWGLEQMKAVSLGTRCDNFFYHASISPRADEVLTAQEWDEAFDRLEQRLGLTGQPRLVVEHTKDGRTHRHGLWQRVDPETMTAISDSKTYPVHQRVADELEKLFGHERTPRGSPTERRNPKDYEVFRGKKSGIDPYDVGAELTALWRQADGPQAFAAALEEHGYILAEGRRGLCVVDPAGQEHSLARRIAGARKKDIEARMAGFDRSALPSVEEARTLARSRRAGRHGPEEARPEPDPARPDPSPEKPGHASSGAANDERRKPETESSPVYSQDFDQLARQFTRESSLMRELAGAVAAVTESTLSQFERAAHALRRGGEPSLAASLKRLEDRVGREAAPVDDKGTEFRRVAEATKRAMRENGGEPVMPGGMSFWQRTAAVLSAAYERATSWAKGLVESFVERVRRSRNNPEHQSELER